MVHLLCICSQLFWCIDSPTCDTGVPLQTESAALQSLVSPASCSPDTKKTQQIINNTKGKTLLLQSTILPQPKLKALSICRIIFCCQFAPTKCGKNFLEGVCKKHRIKPPVLNAIHLHHSHL